MNLLQQFVECCHNLRFGPVLEIARPRPPGGVAAERELVRRREVATAAIGQANHHREGKRTGLLDGQDGIAPMPKSPMRRAWSLSSLVAGQLAMSVVSRA